MPERGRLIVHGEGEVEVDFVVAFLADLQNAYSSILAFEIISRHIGDWPFPFEPFFGSGAALIRRGPRRGIQLVGEWPPTPDKIATMIPDAERLVLASVDIASPGVWEFLGTLSPLEVLRRYLSDRHERRKDRDYRETAEQRRLHLENLKLEDGIIADRIRLAREMGATDRDLAPLLNALVNRPLMALDKHQDRRLIGGAELSGIKKPGTDP